MPGDLGYPKHLRIRKRAEYLRIQKTGRRQHTDSFVVLKVPGVARLGVTVSSRVGGAVTRNRVKRYVREAFRVSREAVGDVDVVVIAKDGARTLSQTAVLAELRGALFGR